ncbi:STAS domain-containing protein [Jeotgalibacillus sp. S-D1]|uniref:STAS domain-containing protein n=1 Tax=Jeotgalibacillus sp. S-D1 TaxID=2552189 RepID=UPI001059FB3E|nr:STAS domain-containing protein [Jeotgalibacillus sp. S-D1]TDL30736.1 STAS domain-containing protein [Jeotgalibacillus sp. S-D1]
MSNIDSLPLPSIVMDRHMNIVQSSEDAIRLFSHADSFLEWVDKESIEKAKKFLTDPKQSKIELNMKTAENITSLYTLHFKWTGEACTILFQQQDELLANLMKTINEHKLRLQDSDMELVLKNQQLLTSFKRIQELSTAVIHLSPTVILIPIFGALDGTLLAESKTRILSHVSDSQIDELIVDLQSVSSLEPKGINQLKELIKNCSLMGAKTYISGVKPEHVDLLNQHHMLDHAVFINTLKHTIKRLV